MKFQKRIALNVRRAATKNRAEADRQLKKLKAEGRSYHITDLAAQMHLLNKAALESYEQVKLAEAINAVQPWAPVPIPVMLDVPKAAIAMVKRSLRTYGKSLNVRDVQNLLLKVEGYNAA